MTSPTLRSPAGTHTCSCLYAAPREPTRGTRVVRRTSSGWLSVHCNARFWVRIVSSGLNPVWWLTRTSRVRNPSSVRDQTWSPGATSAIGTGPRSVDTSASAGRQNVALSVICRTGGGMSNTPATSSRLIFRDSMYANSSAFNWNGIAVMPDGNSSVDPALSEPL